MSLPELVPRRTSELAPIPISRPPSLSVGPIPIGDRSRIDTSILPTHPVPLNVAAGIKQPPSRKLERICSVRPKIFWLSLALTSVFILGLMGGIAGVLMADRQKTYEPPSIPTSNRREKREADDRSSNVIKNSTNPTSPSDDSNLMPKTNAPTAPSPTLAQSSSIIASPSVTSDQFVAPTSGVVALDYPAMNDSRTAKVYKGGKVYNFQTNCDVDITLKSEPDKFVLTTHSFEACLQACGEVNFRLGERTCIAAAFIANLTTAFKWANLGGDCFLKNYTTPLLPRPWFERRVVATLI